MSILQKTTLALLFPLVACGGGGTDSGVTATPTPTNPANNGSTPVSSGVFQGGSVSQPSLPISPTLPTSVNFTDMTACQALGMSTLTTPANTGVVFKSYTPYIVRGDMCGNFNLSPIVLLYSTKTGVNGGAICTGSLIAADKVLTAAHCVDKISAMSIYHGTSSTKLSKALVKNWLAHPEYASTLQTDSVALNDVAVVTLSAPLNLPTLPILGSAFPSVGSKTAIVGYGLTDSNAADAGIFRAGFQNLTAVLPEYMEATYTTGYSNTCQGDSGGPMLLPFNGSLHITGITSSGDPVNCSQVNTNSQFMPMANNRILNFVRQQAPNATFN